MPHNYLQPNHHHHDQDHHYLFKCHSHVVTTFLKKKITSEMIMIMKY